MEWTAQGRKGLGKSGKIVHLQTRAVLLMFLTSCVYVFPAQTLVATVALAQRRSRLALPLRCCYSAVLDNMLNHKAALTLEHVAWF